MRITKALCEEIVSKLVDPITAKMKENEVKIAAIVQEAILAKCPKEVVTLWKAKSKHLYTRSSLTVYYLGQYTYANFDVNVPWFSNQFNIENVETANKVQSFANDNITLKKKKFELSKELEVTILKLSTYARITEQFPEAASLLPTEKRMEIALNIQDTRDKLKNLP
jgi:hypothetical protein